MQANLAILYAGLGGTLLALIIATATNGWKPRVFFLLLLRLAIGWHFLFEGLHKIHSDFLGETENSKPFTSEPYFRAAEGPLGDVMRAKYLGDPDAIIAERIAPNPGHLVGFEKLALPDQASLCPASVAKRLEEVANENLAAAEAELPKLESESTTAKAASDKVKDGTDTKAAEAAKKKSDEATTKVAAQKQKIAALRDNGQGLKVAYARWMYGVDPQDAKVKFFSNDVPQTVVERLKQIDLMKKQVEELHARHEEHLGQGYGYDLTKTKAAKADLTAAKNDLVRDAEAFANNLVVYAGGKLPEPGEKPIKSLDRITMYAITGIGALLLMGLFTRLGCLGGAGFLIMTYLSHPTVPWLPLPPGTEGNPLFINKNLIEAFALLTLMCFPTGRWLGLDALIARLIWKGKETVV